MYLTRSVHPGVARVDPGIARVHQGVARVDPGTARVHPGVSLMASLTHSSNTGEDKPALKRHWPRLSLCNIHQLLSQCNAAIDYAAADTAQGAVFKGSDVCSTGS